MKKINKIFALLFAFLMFINPIINVFAETNGNNQRQIGNTGGESVGDGVKISKTISPSELENYFDITLKVQTTEIAKEQDLAVVIVMDISRTMIQNKLEGENTTRLRAALNAGQKFVETFASNSNNVDAKRQLGYVAFNRDGHVLADIQECKSMDTANKINKDVYDKTISITKTIDSDNDVYGNDKTRFTNIEGGLQVAYDMLYNNTNTKDIKNKYIIFFSNDIENRLRKNFLGKQITTSLKKEKIPLSKYTTPLLFTIDSNNTVQNIFIPDKDDTESLRNYLKKIKNNYFSKM